MVSVKAKWTFPMIRDGQFHGTITSSYPSLLGWSSLTMGHCEEGDITWPIPGKKLHLVIQVMVYYVMISPKDSWESRYRDAMMMRMTILEYISNLFSRKMMQNCAILTVDLLNFYELLKLNNIS
ncbi:hypothetical protein PV326_007520 [Microctonus aethiopoides]|nr:hypothetical protein PV326_007520 [Microctonus aethiopoides]